MANSLSEVGVIQDTQLGSQLFSTALEAIKKKLNDQSSRWVGDRPSAIKLLFSLAQKLHARAIVRPSCGVCECSQIYALPCPALHCLALPCIALPCLALPCIALHCPALHCPALPCPALHCPALPCLALPCLALPLPAWVAGRAGQTGAKPEAEHLAMCPSMIIWTIDVCEYIAQRIQLY